MNKTLAEIMATPISDEEYQEFMADPAKEVRSQWERMLVHISSKDVARLLLIHEAVSVPPAEGALRLLGMLGLLVNFTEVGGRIEFVNPPSK